MLVSTLKEGWREDYLAAYLSFRFAGASFSSTVHVPSPRGARHIEYIDLLEKRLEELNKCETEWFSPPNVFA